MQSGIAQRRQIEGWGFSLVFHGILLGAVVPLFPHLPTATHLEPFRWNVMLVESPQETTPVETDSGASFGEKVLRSTGAGVHSSVSPPTDVPKPHKQTKSNRDYIANESRDTGHLLATAPPTLIAQSQPEVSPPMPSTTETTPVTQETLLDEQPKTNSVARQVRSEPSVRPCSQ